LEELLKTTFNLNVFEKAGIKTEKKFFDSTIKLLRELKEELNTKEKEKFFLLSLVSPESLQNACRLGFSEPEIEKIKKHLETIRELLEKWKKLSVWEKIEVFERIPVPYLLALSVYFPRIRKDVVKFLKRYRKIKPELTGDELIELGVKEGKEIGRFLELLRKEKIEGKVKTKEDEKNFIAQFLLNKSKN